MRPAPRGIRIVVVLLSVVSILVLACAVFVSFRKQIVRRYIRAGRTADIVGKDGYDSVLTEMAPELIEQHRRSYCEDTRARSHGKLSVDAFNRRITAWNALLVIVRNNMSAEVEEYVRFHLSNGSPLKDEVFNAEQKGIRESGDTNRL